MDRLKELAGAALILAAAGGAALYALIRPQKWLVLAGLATAGLFALGAYTLAVLAGVVVLGLIAWEGRYPGPPR